LLAVLLAPACAACGETLERPMAGAVCGACWARVAWLPRPLCDVLPRAPGRSPVRAHQAAGLYDGALRSILHAFKYEGRRTLARPLGRMLREAGEGLLSGASCAVPVPLHPWRRIERGFNQSADLAGTLDMPVVHALWRSRRTLPQTGLSRARRRRNVRGAFAVSPLLRRRTLAHVIAGRTVVLIDDVRTTGATLDACARVLRRAGAAEVRALTVARA
jgi:ComF family protein